MTNLQKVWDRVDVQDGQRVAPGHLQPRRSPVFPGRETEDWPEGPEVVLDVGLEVGETPESDAETETETKRPREASIQGGSTVLT